MNHQSQKKSTPTFSKASLYFIIISLSLLAILIISVLASSKKSTSTVQEKPRITSTPEIKQEKNTNPQSSIVINSGWLEKYIEKVFLKDQTKVWCIVSPPGKLAGIYFLSSSRPWSEIEFLGAAVGVFSAFSDTVWGNLQIKKFEIAFDKNKTGHYEINLRDCEYLGSLPEGTLTEQIIFEKLRWIE